MNTNRPEAWGRLYSAASRLAAYLGAHGSVDAKSDLGALLVEALDGIDGANYCPGLMPADVAAAQARRPRAWAHHGGSVANRSAETTWGLAELKRHGWVPLYEWPERKPLTFAQMNEAARSAQIAYCLDSHTSYDVALIREVERMHGIDCLTGK